MNQQIFHNGDDVTAYTISYVRDKVLCSGVGTLHVNIAVTYPTTITLYDTFTVYEDGTKKGTYFVHTVNKDLPSATITAACQDASIKLEEYFISQSWVIDYPSNSGTWIARFLDDATVSHTTVPLGTLLNNDTTLGMMSASDQITSLLQQNNWYISFDEDNVATVGKIEVNLSDIDVVVSGDEIINLTTISHDKMFRNRVIVWGKGDPTTKRWVNTDLNQTGKYPNEYDNSDTRTTVIANSNISSVGAAKLLAKRLLNEFEKTNFEIELDLAGYYNIKVGDIVGVDSEFLISSGVVTTLSISVGSEGVITHLKLNERCVQLFAFYEYDGYVYVGTKGAGVWRKPLKYSHVWENFSSGLTDLNITDLAIKDNVFACVSDEGKLFTRYLDDTGWGQLNPRLYDPVTSGYIPTNSGICTSCAIDKTTNNVLATFSAAGSGYAGWIVDAYSRANYTATYFTASGTTVYRPVAIDNNGVENVVITENLGSTPALWNSLGGVSPTVGDANQTKSPEYGYKNTSINLITGNTLVEGAWESSAYPPSILSDANYAYVVTSISSATGVEIKEIDVSTSSIIGTLQETYSPSGGYSYSVLPGACFLGGNRKVYVFVRKAGTGFISVEVWCFNFNDSTTQQVADTGNMADYYDGLSSPVFLQINGTKRVVLAVSNRGLNYTIDVSVRFVDFTFDTETFSITQPVVVAPEALPYSTGSVAFTSAYASDTGKVFLYAPYSFNASSSIFDPSIVSAPVFIFYDCVSRIVNVQNNYGSAVIPNTSTTLYAAGWLGDTLYTRIGTYGDPTTILTYKVTSVTGAATVTETGMTAGYSCLFNNREKLYFAIQNDVSVKTELWDAFTNTKVKDVDKEDVYAVRGYGNVLTVEETVFREYPPTPYTALTGSVGLYSIDNNSSTLVDTPGGTLIFATSVFDCLFVITRYISDGAWYFYIPTVRNLITNESDLSEVRSIFRGYKEVPYSRIATISTANQVEISQGQPVMIYGGLSYSGILVSGIYPTWTNLGELQVSAIPPGPYSHPVLGANMSYVSDARSFHVVQSGIDGEPEYKTYVMYPELTDPIIDVTDTNIVLLDATYELPLVWYPNSSSGILASGVSTLHTFSGFANHLETTNYQDVPYIFASISGVPPVFWQKDSYEFGDTVTVFEDRTTNLPDAEILVIRVDDYV